MNNFNKLKIKYPDKIPIIVISDDIAITKNKYLVNKDMLVSHFLGIVRKYIEINSGQAIFITINGILVPSNKSIGDIENNNDFLYIKLSLENTFG
jgi:hypothetical protein